MEILAEIVRWLLLVVVMFLAVGTVINHAHVPHWFLRGWDFPRVQIAGGLAVCGGLYGWGFAQWTNWVDLMVVISAAVTLVVQLTWIVPYLPGTPRQVQRSDGRPGQTLRLVISNVEMENRSYDRWMAVIREVDPDVVLAVEIDDGWFDALKPLALTHPFTIARPQGNHYGMALLSRLKLTKPHIRFVVESAVPSVHAILTLPSGAEVELHGVHPRPPEPRSGQHATPRDAELVVLGREIAESHRPQIIAGDLNDVAWSHTTDLFLRVSRMLDPRRGRGFFNTWHARSRFWRFPLDHIFHSDDLRLVDLRVLGDVGSDHFPVLAVLSYEPDAISAQEQEAKDHTDVREAQARIHAAERETDRRVQSPQREKE